VLFGDQREARRQDRREREEQSCDAVPRHQTDRTDDDRDREPEREPDRQAPGMYVPEPRWFECDAFLGTVELEQRLVPAYGRAEVHQLIAVTAPYANAATAPHETSASAEPRSAPKRSTVTTAVRQYASIAKPAKIIDNDWT